MDGAGGLTHVLYEWEPTSLRIRIPRYRSVHVARVGLIQRERLSTVEPGLNGQEARRLHWETVVR